MQQKTPPQIGFWQLLLSVAAAMFGVQSQNNYVRDFQETSFVPFLMIGILFVFALVISLVTLVNFIS
jgi:hypothetical protein